MTHSLTSIIWLEARTLDFRQRSLRVDTKRSSSNQFSRCLVEFLPVISYARDQVAGLLPAETIFLCEVTNFKFLLFGDAAAVGLTDFIFVIGHGDLLLL
jgi:hypothetical protein